MYNNNRFVTIYSFFTSRISSFSGAELSAFFCFPADFLYNCPRTVTTVAELTSGARPLDNSFGASHEGLIRFDLQRQIARRALHGFPACSHVQFRDSDNTVVRRLQKLSRLKLPVFFWGDINLSINQTDFDICNARLAL